MISFSSAELHTWIASFLWPLARILGLISVAPLFGNVSIPARIKLGLGVMLAIVIAPAVPALPATDPTSLPGLLILAQQMVIGLAMGFAMRIVFSAFELAGDISSMTMGLGFAIFYDPQTRARSSAISQFVALLGLMIYLATDLHLVLLATLAQSFTTLPISEAPIASAGFKQLVTWGAIIFGGGIQLALPVVAALLLTNLALGILTRAAPQLNLFNIGFPITISVGLIMVGLSLSLLSMPIVRLLHEAISVINQMTAAMAGR